mgnify:CR=1 FL=1
MSFSNLLPSGSESETERDGFLSSRAELHAVAVGFLAGVLLAVTRRIEVAALFGAVVFGTRKVRGHLKDARREAAYTALGFILPLPAYLWGIAA